ncbi:undecaprenyl/decaprenyl-phosphate alpha-N-acetylglucosaminyl 1-phosphate transferase [Candidatus Peregrinibacteria bacterium]|nr:undecaprenyl/decaprenyl-phosphate alpha-N-acetylglucosaminyl 1-phosphate transferase [Candidatus Peregrinibacteria bacterium]
MKLMDRPQKYGLKRAPIPYYGGVAIFIVFIISLLLFVPFSKELFGLIIGSSIIVVLGFLDDMFNLNPFLRLFVQFLACVVLVIFGIGILSFKIPFFGTLGLSGYFSAVFTIVWVMVVLNTMNFVDGVSGLSSGVSFISALTIFALSVHPLIHADPLSQISVAKAALIIAGSAFAFLIFDFPPAKILMGDTGSTFFGFTIAALAIFSGGKVATAFLVLGIPILDMIWVVLRRLFSGGKIWRGDLKHLHHRFLNLGLSSRGVVLLYLAVTAALGGLAVTFVSSEQKMFILIGLVILMIVLAAMLILFSKKRV